jgi:hypothetical protein
MFSKGLKLASLIFYMADSMFFTTAPNAQEYQSQQAGFYAVQTRHAGESQARAGYHHS